MSLWFQSVGNRGLVLFVIAVYSALTLWMSLHVPFFEAPDAYYHFAVIDHIAETGQLPPADDPANQPWRQMTFHAPLYYMLSAALIRPLERPDFPESYRLNPHAQVGEPHAADNQNFVAHVVDQDAAVWLVRAFSMSLGLLSVVGVYVLARLLLPDQRLLAFIAALLLALNPQFLFIHSVVTNDTLVITLATWTLVLLVHMVQQGLSVRRLLLLASMAAATSLAKASGMTLYPIVALAGLYVCWRDHVPLRRVLFYAFIGLLVWSIIAGWWYWHNWTAYGDFSASSQIAQATAARTGGIPDLFAEMRGLYYSFWALFGWFNVSPPSVFYLLPSLLIMASALGLVMQSMRHPALTQDQKLLAGLGGLYVLVFILSWWIFHQKVNAAQGRLWFPLMGVFAPVLALGLLHWPRWFTLVLLLPLGLAALIFPVTVIQPAYAANTPISAESWQAPANTRHFRIREPWAEAACLSVWTSPVQRSEDGRALEVDLWWRVDCAFTGLWSTFIHLIDSGQESCIAGDTRYILAQYDSMPNGGDRPFPAMQPGWVYPDQLRLNLPAEGLPANADGLHVGLYDAGGTFMRAFVAVEGDAPDTAVRIGRCAPETLLYALPALP